MRSDKLFSGAVILLVILIAVIMWSFLRESETLRSGSQLESPEVLKNTPPPAPKNNIDLPENTGGDAGQELSLPLRSEELLSLEAREQAKKEGIGRPVREFPDILFNISGNENFTDEEIIATFRIPPVYNDRLLDRLGRKQTLDFYRSRGFTAAWVPSLEVQEGSLTIVDIVVEEGDVYTMGQVEIEGVTFFSHSSVRALYLKPGELANQVQLAQADELLKEAYKNKGFLDVKTKSQRSGASEVREFNYKVVVIEGTRYRVGEITIPAAYRRDFPFRKGDSFEANRWLDYVATLNLLEHQVVVDRYPEEGEVEIELFE